jgi:hypothetical protein
MEDETAATADAVPSMAPAPPHGHKSTAVDGQGMWRSWTRVFARPESACLDLLDNCFDAALKLGFRGRVEMSSRHTNGNEVWLSSTVTIQNNSESDIKPLEAALTVYKSSKNTAHDYDHDDKDAIGENGVGLKHGCATLSDCSMVLTRNHSTVEIGIIAKQLQSSSGVFLPSFTFDIQDPAELRSVVKRWLQMNPEIMQTLSASFGTTVDVEEQVTNFGGYLYRNDWNKEDHVFLVVLCNLKANPDVPHDLIESVSPAKAFLRDIKTMLPEHYINLPAQGMFEFDIDNGRVDFSYWQHRLVELTKFEVYIPTNQPFEHLPDADWDKPSSDKYPLSIYCGFDAQRLDQNMRLKQGTSSCVLYIHSCQAGRLVKKEIDARHMLGLGTSGVDFTQGLTVIINDVAGKLPLTPTKDGIAWSEQANGDIHRKNLLSWAGGVAAFFWTHHKNTAGQGRTSNNIKEVMKKAIASFVEDQRTNNAEVTQNMENGDFTQFQRIPWKRSEWGFDNTWKIRRGASGSITAVTGPDTLFRLSPERLQLIRNGSKPNANDRNQQIRNGSKPTAKRKSTSNLNDTPSKRALKFYNGNADMPSVQRLLAQPLPELSIDPWDEVNPKDIQRISFGVLSFFREKDTEGFFEIPVWEAFPDVKKEVYMQVVPNPMCFRDIENEQMKTYKSIRELQDDLVLVFQNCLRFNEHSSIYAKLAQNMLDSLEEAIQTTGIKQVTVRVLNYFRALDDRELFELPVVEQCPQLKEVYLQKVHKPMDFHTIEEERIHSYTSMADLLQDLELIFHNCISFNSSDGPDDNFFQGVARQMLKMLEKDFEDLVNGKLGVRKLRKKPKLNYAEIEGQNMNTSQDSISRPKPKPKMDYTSLKRQLQLAEKKVESLKQEATNCAAQIRFVEERRIRQVHALEKRLEDQTVRIAHLESQPHFAPSAKQQELERKILNRDARIAFLETEQFALKREVAQLRKQVVAERDQHIRQLKRGQPQNQLGHAAWDTATPVVGGIPRTVSLPEGPLGLVISESHNRLVVSKVLENGPMHGKISPGDIMFAFCSLDTRSMKLSEFEAHFAESANQKRTLTVVTPSNCFLDEDDCSGFLYKTRKGMPIESAVEGQAPDQPASISGDLGKQQLVPDVSNMHQQAQNKLDVDQGAGQPDIHEPHVEEEQIHSITISKQPAVQDQAKTHLAARGLVSHQITDPLPNVPQIESQSSCALSPNCVDDILISNGPQGKDVDLQWLLRHRSDKMSDGEKIRVQQFMEGFNPTPDQPIYKMKIHEKRGTDPETGEDFKETFYLELNYHDFSKNETKKIKRY